MIQDAGGNTKAKFHMPNEIQNPHAKFWPVILSPSRCHSERSEESFFIAQDRLCEASLFFHVNKTGSFVALRMTSSVRDQHSLADIRLTIDQ
jgi:hypothetical protein